MSELCRWFDRYRDGELSPEKNRQFQSHLESCDRCRRKLVLLNGLVRTLRKEEAVMAVIHPERIAARALENADSRDVLFLSWLKPALAWPALVLLLAVLSGVWISPLMRQPYAYRGYEMLLAQGEQSGTDQSLPETMTDSELEDWLNQQGNNQ